MRGREKKIEEDEKFIVEAKGRFSSLNGLQAAIEHYLVEKHGGRKGIRIFFDEARHEWVVETKKGQKRVSYVEGVPKAVSELL